MERAKDEDRRGAVERTTGRWYTALMRSSPAAACKRTPWAPACAARLAKVSASRADGASARIKRAGILRVCARRVLERGDRGPGSGANEPVDGVGGFLDLLDGRLVAELRCVEHTVLEMIVE